MNNIDEIMYLIDWKRNEQEQKIGIEMAREVSCLKAFFRPIGPAYSKSVWDNCAIIICAHSDEELEPYIIEMLLWLEDLNWPGAEMIQQRLLDFRKIDILAVYINSMVPALEKLGRNNWLGSIAELMQNTALRNCLHQEVRQALCTHTTR